MGTDHVPWNTAGQHVRLEPLSGALLMLSVQANTAGEIDPDKVLAWPAFR